MLYKFQVDWILLLVISFYTLSVILVYNNIQIAVAQNEDANFLSYTNTHLGFIIRYPPDWIVNDSDIVNGHKLTSFTSADKVGIVFVQIQNATQGEIAVYNMNDSAKTNTIRTHLIAGETLLELDVNHYVLSGHPAIRIIETQGFGGPGQPISSKPYDAKGMIYSVISGGKFYKVAYMVTPPERFPNHLQIAQLMINSFLIMNK